MGQNRVMLGRQSPLYVNDELIEGILQTSVPGATSQRFPIGDVLDSVRRFAADIPDPGVATFVLHFNPADNLHRKLLQYQENDTLVRFKWQTVGKVVGDLKTKAGVGKGTVTVQNLALQTDKSMALIDWSNFTVDEPSIGDYLNTDADAIKLQVIAADYSDAAGIKMLVKNAKNGNLTAISDTATAFTLTQPAVRVEFVGTIGGLPMQGGQTITAAGQVTIDGEVEFKVGTPDLAT